MDVKSMLTWSEVLESTIDLAFRVKMLLFEINNTRGGLVRLRIQDADGFPGGVGTSTV